MLLARTCYPWTNNHTVFCRPPGSSCVSHQTRPAEQAGPPTLVLAGPGTPWDACPHTANVRRSPVFTDRPLDMATLRFGHHLVKSSAVILQTELSFALVNRKPVVPGRIFSLLLDGGAAKVSVPRGASAGIGATFTCW